MRDECAKPGTICAWVAASPRPGKLRLPMCVDCIVSPSGSVMLSGCSALRLFSIGTLGSRKCAVAPESAIASFVPTVRVICTWVVSVRVEYDT